jgi:flagellar hook capping protein FlgD
VPGMDSSSNAIVEGGVGYLAVMSEAKTVTFAGKPWRNTQSNLAAPGRYNAGQGTNTPLLVVLGKAVFPGVSELPEGVGIQIKYPNTGVSKTAIANSSGNYAAALIDIPGNGKPGVSAICKSGDVIQVQVTDPRWISETITHTLTAEDIRLNYVVLPPIQLEIIPTESVLLPNYPNPFNPETWIPYRLSQDAEVSIEIYSLSGRQIRTLTMGKKAAGNYVDRYKAAYWDGTNDVGEAVASGIYFYVIRAGEFEAIRRMAILK